MLRHFEQATREISADKYLSVSKEIPLTSSLPCVIVERTSLHAIKQKLLSSMVRRFTNIEISYSEHTTGPIVQEGWLWNASACSQAVQRHTSEVASNNTKEFTKTAADEPSGL